MPRIFFPVLAQNFHLSSLTMWNLESYTTTVLNERMWLFLGGEGADGSVKTLSDPPTYFRGQDPQDLRPWLVGSVTTCVGVCVCVCVCVWVWYGMQQYDVVELLGRRVGPLTCVISRLHSAGSSVRTADVTADSVLFSLVELTLSWCFAQLTRLARTSYILKLFWCWTRKQM